MHSLSNGADSIFEVEQAADPTTTQPADTHAIARTILYTFFTQHFFPGIGRNSREFLEFQIPRNSELLALLLVAK